MKEFNGKTLEKALEEASKELGVPAEKIEYTVIEEKKGLFSKSVTIAVPSIEDALEYAKSYLSESISLLGVEVELDGYVDGDIIHLTIKSERNPILIGTGGKTLQAFNELTRLAVSAHFKHRYRVLLDVGGYKEERYEKVARIARREAKSVQKTKGSAKLNPMTPDERRIVHNALNGMPHITTESEGEGGNRAVVIKYVD